MHGTNIAEYLQKTQMHSSLPAAGPTEWFHGIADT